MDVEMVNAPSSDAVTNLPDLPCEIQFIIYDNLAAYPDSLAAIVRTCKGTRDPARRVLYDNIMVDNGDMARLFEDQSIDLAGSISPSLQALSQNWRQAKIKHVQRQELTCKNLKLLEFPYDPKFFENASDIEYYDKLKEQLLPTTNPLPNSRPSVNNKNALQIKADIVATFRGIRTLAIDLPGAEDFFGYVLKALIQLRKDKNWEAYCDGFQGSEDLWVTPRAATKNPGKLAVSDLLQDHFSSLHSIELRSPFTLHLSQNDISQGTIVLQGSWSQFPSLRTFKFHGHSFADDICEKFLNVAKPDTIALNGFACNGRHHVFNSLLNTSRDELRNTVSNFSWKNMNPCMSVMRTIEEVLAPQVKSLKSLSLVRRRLERDLLRYQEQFVSGSLEFTKFTNLEYLDVDTRYFVNSNSQDIDDLSEWLGLPVSLQTLSLDAVTDNEVKYFEVYMNNLLDAVRSGLLPNLKTVRCGFMGIRGGKKVQSWKILGNMPGKFLCHGVWVTGWEYDSEDDEGDSIAARVRMRAVRRRRLEVS